jgi:hypothetical protein
MSICKCVQYTITPNRIDDVDRCREFVRNGRNETTIRHGPGGNRWGWSSWSHLHKHKRAHNCKLDPLARRLRLPMIPPEHDPSSSLRRPSCSFDLFPMDVSSSRSEGRLPRERPARREGGSESGSQCMRHGLDLLHHQQQQPPPLLLLRPRPSEESAAM